jgi:hypothetical protein
MNDPPVEPHVGSPRQVFDVRGVEVNDMAPLKERNPVRLFDVDALEAWRDEHALGQLAQWLYFHVTAFKRGDGLDDVPVVVAGVKSQAQTSSSRRKISVETHAAVTW